MRVRSVFRVVALTLLSIGSLHAATFTVTRLDDPAPGTCDAGDCSLREAVQAANATPDADRIDTPAGLIQLALGELAIVGPLEIAGAARDASTVRGDGVAAMLRVLPSARLELRDLALEGPDPFLATMPSGSIADAVIVGDDGHLLLERVDVSLGAGLVRSLADSHAQMSLRDSSVLFLQGAHDTGSMMLEDSRVQVMAVYGGDLELRASAITGLLREGISSGASIETDGIVLIEDTDITDTFGGLQFQGRVPESVDMRRMRYARNAQPLTARLALEMNIEDSEFVDNRNIETGDDGGPGAIHAYLGATYRIDRTSFIGNTGSGDAGGAILVEVNAALYLTNSTFSGNGFTVAAAQEGARGAALAVRAGNALSRAELVNTTVVSPTVFPVGVTGTALAVIGADTQVDIAVHNSIVRGSCDLGLVPAGLMDAAAGNVKSGSDDCGFDGSTNQLDVTSTAMALGTLGDHGAFGRTYLPATGSVAIDAATDEQCPALDQRGFARSPDPGQCDVGAVEVGADDLIFEHDFEL